MAGARYSNVQNKPKAKPGDGAPEIVVLATNRKARHDYELRDSLECGMVLQGSEVKALRESKVQITDAWAEIDRGELWLVGLHIAPYSHSQRYNGHLPERRRKLLAHRHEVDRLEHRLQLERLTLVPTRLYFKDGRVKVEISVAKGRKSHDRRQDIAKRDAERDARRELAQRNR